MNKGNDEEVRHNDQSGLTPGVDIHDVDEKHAQD
jgi:hypothetical protein